MSDRDTQIERIFLLDLRKRLAHPPHGEPAKTTVETAIGMIDDHVSATQRRVMGQYRHALAGGVVDGEVLREVPVITAG